MGHNKLTAKQEGFAKDIANKKYTFHWEAYAANYNVSPKTSKNTLYVKSCELMSNGKVAERIKEIEGKIKAREKVTLDEILIKLSKRVNLDIREMFDNDDCMKPIHKLTQEQAMFLASFDVLEIWEWEEYEDAAGKKKKRKIQTGVLKKVKLESIKDIMDMLIKHYGGYAKDDTPANSNLEAIRDIINAVK